MSPLYYYIYIRFVLYTMRSNKIDSIIIKINNHTITSNCPSSIVPPSVSYILKMFSPIPYIYISYLESNLRPLRYILSILSHIF